MSLTALANCPVVQGFAGFFQSSNGSDLVVNLLGRGLLQGCRKTDTFSPQVWRGDNGARRVQTRAARPLVGWDRDQLVGVAWAIA